MITGKMLIGQSAVRGDKGSLAAINPATHEKLSPDFGVGGIADIDQACTLAQHACDPYRATTPEQRGAGRGTRATGDRPEPDRAARRCCWSCTCSAWRKGVPGWRLLRINH